MDRPIFLFMLICGLILIVGSTAWFAIDSRKTDRLLKIAKTEKGELQSVISDAGQMVDELNNISEYLLTQIDKKYSEADSYIERMDETLNSARTEFGALPVYAVDSAGDGSGGSAADSATDIYEKADVGADGQTGADNDADVSADAAANAYTDDAVANAYADDAVTNAYTDDAVANAYTDDAVANAYTDDAAANAYTDDDTDIDAGDSAGVGADAGVDVGADIFETRGPAAPLVTLSEKKRAQKLGSRLYNQRNAAMSHNRVYLEVLRCDEEGMDEAEIARALNIGRGEVALIIGLREGGAV